MRNCMPVYLQYSEMPYLFIERAPICDLFHAQHLRVVLLWDLAWVESMPKLPKPRTWCWMAKDLTFPARSNRTVDDSSILCCNQCCSIRSFHSIHNVDRGVLQAMLEDLAGQDGHRDHLTIWKRSIEIDNRLCMPVALRIDEVQMWHLVAIL